MDICIITNDIKLGRFIELELREAGYEAFVSEKPKENAALYICDMDYYTEEMTDNAIGFSYDSSKHTLVTSFLQRPIDSEMLVETVSKKLGGKALSGDKILLEVEKATRMLKTALGEVRLSEKELSLFLVLCEKPLLTRDTGAEIFGDGESNVVDVYMHYLRKKLSGICPEKTIESKRGKGYSLSKKLSVRFI